MKTSAKKSRNKLYLKFIGIITALLVVLTIAGTWISYPTTEHRRVAHQAEQVINKNGGAFSFTGYESKEYIDLSNSSEFIYSSRATMFTTIAQFIILIAIVGQVYNYFRRNNVSPTKRSVGLTATLFTIGGLVSSLLVQYPLAYFTGATVAWDVPYFIALLISGVISFVVYFIIASLFEIVYNKRNSFIVE